MLSMSSDDASGSPDDSVTPAACSAANTGSSMTSTPNGWSAR
ncbi:MAG: hypothetical protein QOF66_4318, partial [Mycobacterium sp.]|nr:hypothetical protein [Mycobacterium sp.]